MESGSEHPEKALGQLPDASEPSPLALHQQHTHEDKYRFPSRQQRQSQQRHRRQNLPILALASFLAILYAVSLCGFRTASKAQPMPARRKLAEGSGAEKFEEVSADFGDPCAYTTLRSDTSPADDTSSSPSSRREEGGLGPLEQGPPAKKKKMTFLAETAETEHKLFVPPAPLEEPLGPELERYIEEMLAVEEELTLPDWMIQPHVNLPADFLDEEEESPVSPKERHKPFSTSAPSRSPGLQYEQILELPLSPGECTSSTSRHPFQAPPARHAQQLPAGESKDDDLRLSDPEPCPSGRAPGFETAQASSPTEEDRLKNHPFYRYTLLPSHLAVRKIDWEFHEISRVYVPHLDALRELSKKHILQPSEAKKFVYQATLLLSFARHYMRKNLIGLNPARAANAAVSMLLVLDTLYAAGAASGSKSDMEIWWKPLMNTIPQNTFTRKRFYTQEMEDHLEILEKVLKMIEIYRAGVRPPASDLVPLKRRVLCISPLKNFRHSQWDPWRADDKEWQDSN